jgi:hypothetical protein
MSGMSPILKRRAFLKIITVAGLGAIPVSGAVLSSSKRSAGKSLLLEETDRDFLRGLASATLEKARVRPGETRGTMPVNCQGATLITPGGDYHSFWIRDFAMSLDCGLIPPEEILPHLRLVARCQNGEKERRLASGAIIPPFAIPDHINFDGGAVFYPGTYSSGEDQGAAPWGPLPPMDDHYYFVHIAYALWQTKRDGAFLDEGVNGRTIFERLVRAFDAPTFDPQTGAAVTSKERRAVGFGFQDSVYLLGSLCFTTLLRYRAARQLAALCHSTGRRKEAGRFTAAAERITKHLVKVFGPSESTGGWLLAATEVGRQPDAWATLFALHLGVLPRKSAERARKTIASAAKEPGKSLEYQGAVRHVPANHYFKPEQCWESGGGAVNTYQSGAFWHTPTGWLVQALEPVDATLARTVCQSFIQHLREQDFRKGKGHGAPWECFGIGMAKAQNPVYLTSVSLPLANL